MIPQTVGAVLAFLTLIAPGLLFELRRERRRPTIEETAFREASRVALTSLVFTLLSLTILSIIRVRRPEWMPDPGLWLRQGRTYLNENYRLIARALLTELLIACTLALLFDRLLAGRAKGDIVPGSLWFHLLRRRRPDGTKPWLHARLKDETEFWGYLGDYTTEEKLENREITLVGPKLEMKSKGSTTYTSLAEWASVDIQADQISFLRITYIDDRTGKTVLPTKPLPSNFLTRSGQRITRLGQRGRRQDSQQELASTTTEHQADRTDNKALDSRLADAVLHAIIAKRAYEIAEHRGASGDPLNDWLEAEREVLSLLGLR